MDNSDIYGHREKNGVTISILGLSSEYIRELHNQSGHQDIFQDYTKQNKYELCTQKNCEIVLSNIDRPNKWNNMS